MVFKTELEPAALLAQLEQRPDAWLLGADQSELLRLTYERTQQLIAQQALDPAPVVFLAEADPVRFLAGLFAACATDCPIFLCNPNWAAAEWQQVFSLIHPTLVFSETALPRCSTAPLPHPLPQPGWIMIPTGGSSGQIRFAIHTWETLSMAVQGFQNFFQIEQVNSCCVLPLYHVSGLMQVLRSWLSGGKLAILPLKALEKRLASERDSGWEFEPAQFCLSLVPTQLQRVLVSSDAVNQLRQFQMIFLGGAPAWEELLITARQHQLPLALTYGMTETAAQVVALKPELFLQGSHGCGQVLPHAAIQIVDVDQSNSDNNLNTQVDIGTALIGRVKIAAKSLMLGYFPVLTGFNEFWTDDLGYFDREGILHITGRNSQKIITGGENVFPVEVEAALRATGLVHDICVVGIPDQTWGEVVTAVYVPTSSAVSISALKSALASRLSSFKHPKQWIAVELLPRNAQGKINIALLKQSL
jgi:O-succinylbenzoic acid--CoA ligase